MVMNGEADNAKQLRCNYFRIRSGDKIVFLTFALGIISLLNACATTPNVTPVRIPDLAYLDTSQNAYLWTSGERSGFGNSPDYATITRIDDVNIPAEYLSWAGIEPVFTWLLKIPAGKHVIEILYKETLIVESIVFEKSRQTLTFIAEPNRTYSPFAADQCSRNYFWIEDWGPYVARSETQRFTFEIMSDLTKLVVAGEAPNNNSCE